MDQQSNNAPEAAAAKFVDCWNKIGVQGDGSCAELEKHIHCRNCSTYSAAAVGFLDRECPVNYLDEWASYFAEEKKKAADLDSRSILIFRIATEWLALPTTVFLAVSEMKPIHTLPHRRKQTVLGLTNVRGELLVCVSLKQALGIESTAHKAEAKKQLTLERLLVVRDESGRLVFPVDEVHGVHHYPVSEVKEVPATVSRATATYTRGILGWQDKSVGILDEQLLFHALDRSLA